jgi:hypothetical protein
LYFNWFITEAGPKIRRQNIQLNFELIGISSISGANGKPIDIKFLKSVPNKINGKNNGFGNW